MLVKTKQVCLDYSEVPAFQTPALSFSHVCLSQCRPGCCRSSLWDLCLLATDRFSCHVFPFDMLSRLLLSFPDPLHWESGTSRQNKTGLSLCSLISLCACSSALISFSPAPTFRVTAFNLNLENRFCSWVRFEIGFSSKCCCFFDDTQVRTLVL